MEPGWAEPGAPKRGDQAVRFAWTEDQVAFRDAVADLLAKQCPPAVVRAAWEAPAGELDRGPWDALVAMGVRDVLAPEDRGGLGLDERSLAPVLTETGRAALPHPLIDTAMVAAPLGVEASMVASDLGGPLVPCAADADALLLRDGDRLVLLHAGVVALEPAETVDRARRAARVASWSGTDATAVTDDPGVIDLAFDRGTLGASAQLVGLARAMLDLTVGYVSERHQFGVPVGSFQAVKHHLANATLAIEFAEPAVARAAHTLAAGDPAEVASRQRDVSMAKALATDAAEVAGRAALQCHGAIGYTVEHDLHLFLKRAWALGRSWGDRSWHLERVAVALEI
jgi:alkylation response protein AidB-like acyl-CoA dehydrogenase